jgi:hypothetical protein
MKEHEGDYRAEILDETATPPAWISNALRFGTVIEAKDYGSDLASRWTLVRRWRVAKLVRGEWVSMGPKYTFEVR